MSIADVQSAISEAELYVPANDENESAQSAFDRNDMGNARRFAFTYRNCLAFREGQRDWLNWNKKIWEPISINRVRQLAERTVDAIGAEARATEDGASRDALLRHALQSGQIGRLHAIEELARGHLSVDESSWDNAPYLLPVTNGTLDLRTGRLGPHRVEDRLTAIVDLEYDEAAQCPNWNRFVNDVTSNNRELARFLQCVVGYTLTGTTQEQVIFILFGPGANGKTTFLEVVRSLLGTYARQTPNATFSARNQDGIRDDLARLSGARFVTSTELESGHQLSEVLVKQLTGGDPVTARALYKNLFEYVPQFKIFLPVNHLPKIRNSDQGIWRRIKIIPFNVIFPDKKQDRNLLQKLKSELPGILAWAVQGAKYWHENGLQIPQSVSRASSSFRATVDTIEGFLSERCDRSSPKAQIPCGVLIKEYRRWCEKNNHEPVSDRELWGSLTARGIETDRTSTNRYRVGIRLRDTSDSSDTKSHCYPKSQKYKKQKKVLSHASPLSPRKRPRKLKRVKS